MPLLLFCAQSHPPGCRSYGKAIRCVLRFRGAAVKHGQAQQFNGFLNELAARYEGSDAHGSFWTALMAERVRPISAAECEGGVPEATASQFLKDHMETQKACGAVPVTVTCTL